MAESDIKQEVWSEGERARNEVMNSYYEVIRCYPEYMTGLKMFGKNDLRLFQRWRNNLHRLFLFMQSYERENIKDIEFSEKNASNLIWLEKTTHRILNLKSIIKLTSLGKILWDNEPIVQYRKENYGEDIGV